MVGGKLSSVLCILWLWLRDFLALLNFLWLLKLMSVWVDLMFFVNLFPLHLFLLSHIQRFKHWPYSRVLLQCDVNIFYDANKQKWCVRSIMLCCSGFKCTCWLKSYVAMFKWFCCVATVKHGHASMLWEKKKVDLTPVLVPCLKPEPQSLW